MPPLRRPASLTLFVLAACLGPALPPGPPADAGTLPGSDAGLDGGALPGGDAGVQPGSDAGTLPDGGPGADAGLGADAGQAPSRLDAFTWIPLDGTQCASGARAGLGLDEGRADAGQLFVYLMGGGACWNQGTCAPSLLRWGPVCEYGGEGTLCFWDGAGGTQPTAVYVTAPDPFPADGGGAFRAELAPLAASAALDRRRADNPFRDATFVFVPYCTGDQHTGAAVRTYATKYGLLDPPGTTTIHHAGVANLEAVLASLVQRYPGTRTVWLTGSSAGGYGATFHFQRTWEAFPDAEVSLLADSAPYLDTPHWPEWRAAWNPQLPAACGGGCDGGLPDIHAAVAQAAGARRMGLLTTDADAVVSWFFYAPPGIGSLLMPPTGTFTASLEALLARDQATPNARAFVVPGTTHVLLGGYGAALLDGGAGPSLRSRDGGTTLRAWVDAWATGAPGWETTR